MTRCLCVCVQITVHSIVYYYKNNHRSEGIRVANARTKVIIFWEITPQQETLCSGRTFFCQNAFETVLFEHEQTSLLQLITRIIKCSRQHQYGLVTQHGLTQILGHPKLFQNLNAPHIFRNWTFLEIQNFGQSIWGHHTKYSS